MVEPGRLHILSASVLHGVDESSYQIDGSKERAEDTRSNEDPLADLGTTRMFVARRYRSDEVIRNRHCGHTENKWQQSEE